MLKEIFTITLLFTIGHTYNLGHTEQKCMYTMSDGTTEPVECSKNQSCYAIVASSHKNDTWHMKYYSMGCWDTLPYCSEDDCVIDMPNFVWVNHQFPGFCCCKGHLCNQNVRFSK